jgi:alkylhydroperoxidase/carboxymuconolactone decarboxylase family protein YurZ
MTNIGDKLTLQAIGNAYKIAQHNERQRFNELAAHVRVAHNNGMSQRQISEAVKLHRLTVARIVKGMDDKRRTLPLDLVETSEI